MNKITTFTSLVIMIFAVSCSHGYGKKDHHQSHKKGHKSKMWEKMDTDKDGAVSKKEFESFHAEKFKKMDANNDGKVSKEEKKAYKMSKCGEKKEKCKNC